MATRKAVRPTLHPRIEKFLRALRRLQPVWVDRSNGADGLRCERGDCPIVIVARAKGLVLNAAGGNWRYVAYGRELGLTKTQADLVAEAADTSEGGSRVVREIRRRLVVIGGKGK